MIIDSDSQNYTKQYTKQCTNKYTKYIYINKYISKYIQIDPIYTNIYKIPGGGGAAPPGPAYILVHLCIPWIYLYVFGYMVGIFLVYFLVAPHEKYFQSLTYT